MKTSSKKKGSLLSPLNGTLNGCNNNLKHETAVVVASVLHGTLEVLAGEVAGADKATVSSVAVLDWSILTTEVLGRIHSRGGDVLNRGLYKRVLGLHVTVALVLDGCVDNGCTAQVVSVVLGCIDKRGSAVDVAADVFAKVVGTVATFGVIPARVDWRMNHRGSHHGVLDWSILTTEVLGRIHSRGGDVLNRGLYKRVLGLHVTVALVLDGCVDNGCTAQVVSVVLGCIDKGGSAAHVAAVLHSTLEVLVRKVAGAINTRVQELRSIKRHLSS
jgi:hypothetical protein